MRCTCGGLVSYGEEVDTDRPVLLHALPPCAAFIDEKPEDFLRLIREHLEKAVLAKPRGNA